MNKRAIVIGATGLVGRALTDQLAEVEHVSEVVTLTRRPAEHPSAKVKNHVVDFDDLDSCAELFSADILFSCLGTTRKQAGSLASQRRVDLDYQYKAAQLAVENGVGHYLLVSSSGADASSTNPYLKMKGELEDKVTALAFERISIFQPSLLLGSRVDFRLGETLASWVLPGLCRLPPLRRFRPITGQEIAEKMSYVSQQSGQALEWFRLDEVFL
ncbi:MAG: NAD(P)H-binding protein [Porticoccaceae bacterium]|nr:NAD(P)H-binding protein [Porticoccaceae bacterium]